MLLLWSVALLLLVPLIYRFYNHIKVIKQVLKLPGPKRHPLFGNAFDLIVDLGKTFLEINFSNKHLFYRNIKSNINKMGKNV